MDSYGKTVYESEKKPTVNKDTNEPVVKNDATFIVKKTEEEKLVYQSASKIYMNGEKVSDEKLETLLKIELAIYEKYKKG